MLLLLSCWIITEIMAEDTSFTHYGLKNSSVCLHVHKNSPFKEGRWKFGDKLVASGDVNPAYTAKVDYLRGNLSLCINELTDKDAGIYIVTFSDLHWTEFTEKHMVVVEEMVPPPLIKTTGLHSNLSAGLCNFMVNCSVQHEWVSSVCEADGCRTSQKSFSKVNITIYTSNRSVVCRGSNHVSTNEASESTDVCFNKPDPEPKDGPKQDPGIIIIIVSTACVILCVCVAVVVWRWSSKKCYKNQEHTAQLIHSQPIETQPRSEPRDSTSSSHSEASYENVDVGQQAGPRQDLDSAQSQTVGTIYSVLQNPGVSRKDANRNESVQAASPSQPVTPQGGETQHPLQVDTVYSMLQKKSEHHLEDQTE